MKFQEFLDSLCCCCSIKCGGYFIGIFGLIWSVLLLIYSLVMSIISSELLKVDWDEVIKNATDHDHDYEHISKEEMERIFNGKLNILSFFLKFFNFYSSSHVFCRIHPSCLCFCLRHRLHLFSHRLKNG